MKFITRSTSAFQGQPGTKIIIVDENERVARFYERTLPGFRRSFKDRCPPVTAPVELLPADMEEVSVRNIWRGWFYCLVFRKPAI